MSNLEQAAQQSPEQLSDEPVAWMYEWNGKKHLTFTDQREIEVAHPNFNKSIPLYTRPRPDDEQMLASAMTLRDYFAAKIIVSTLPICLTNTSAAEEAYKIADAMLEARDSK